MRILALLFALVGITGAAYLDYRWDKEANDPAKRKQVETIRAGVALAKATGLAEEGDTRKIDRKLAKYDAMVKNEQVPYLDKIRGVKDVKQISRHASYLLIAAILGGLGVIFLMFRWGILASLVMAPIPLVMGYHYFPTLIFSGGLVVASVLSVFVGPNKKKREEKADAGNEAKDQVTEKVIVEGAPRGMINRFCCDLCDVILRTARPVPVGKKIRCPHCGKVTPIHRMPTASLQPRAKTIRMKTASTEKKKTRRSA